ncbi:MAG: hypothetical protein WCS34_02795 [Bacteroidales bacterium]
MKRYISLLLFISILSVTSYASDNYPRLYVSNTDKPKIEAKIKNVPWAREAYQRLKNYVEPYADLNLKDPDWLRSRLSMYWKKGERYTQCYLKKQNWDYGEGNAPVPTVRMPGMRVWNKYVNVPLKDRIPYNESGDMLGIDKLNPDNPPVKVSYKKSGHMIRLNNQEILELAEKSAFLYWITGEEKYASMASDVYQTWLIGTYYMNPIKDPTRSTKGLGGWEPGGICGYYDYEQIHDNLGSHASVIYDFLHDYMQEHLNKNIKAVGSLDDVTSEVLKRFINLGMIRGGSQGNWNVNGWNVIIRPILMLKSNDAYADGKGREYYLHFLLKESTKYRVDLPGMLAHYDSVTGLWPESPGYSFGTVNSILQWRVLLQRAGIDIIQDNPVMQKAALAVLPWMDSRGNLIVFGDGRGGSPYYETFENLLPYYRQIGDRESEKKMEAAILIGIQSGNYRRSDASWEGICTYVDALNIDEPIEPERASYSPTHRMIIMKNGVGKKQLMAMLYGGKKRSHLVENGLAVQFYGQGYALAPDAAAYESYWSKDYAYHQKATGANTILPGYTSGDIKIIGMEPVLAVDEYMKEDALTPYLNFADVQASEKRRLIVMMRTSKDAGYYVDMFRSNQNENDYIMHGVGLNLTLEDANGKTLPLEKIEKLDKTYSAGYKWFDDFQRIKIANTYVAKWTFPNQLYSKLWMPSNTEREVYSMTAPSSTFTHGLTPNDCCIAPHRTPTLLVRQDGVNGQEHPFVGVYEAYNGDHELVKSVRSMNADHDAIALEVSAKNGRKDYFVSAGESKKCRAEDIKLNGVFAQVSKINGKLISLYLGNGVQVSCGDITIESVDGLPVYAAVYQENGVWKCSANYPVKVKIGKKLVSLKAGKELML